MEYHIFTSHYDQLTKLLFQTNLTPHLVTEGVIVPSDEEELSGATTPSSKAKLVLLKIAAALDSGITGSFYKLLKVMKSYGNNDIKQLATLIEKEIEQVAKHHGHHVPSIEFATVLADIAEILDVTLKPRKLDNFKLICINLTSRESSLVFNSQEVAKIKACTSVYDLFDELRDHWRYDSHPLLYAIVKKSGSREAIQRLKLFRNKIKYHQKLKLVYNMSQSSQTPLPEGYTKMVAIVEKDYDEITLAECEEIDQMLQNYFGVPALRPPTYEPSDSIKITWYIPIEAAGRVLKKACQAKEEMFFKLLSISFFEVHNIIVLNKKWPSSVQVLSKDNALKANELSVKDGEIDVLKQQNNSLQSENARLQKTIQMDAQSGQEKSVKDEKMLDIIKERDQLQSQLSENDEQLGATRYRLKQTESELSKKIVELQSELSEMRAQAFKQQQELAQLKRENEHYARRRSNSIGYQPMSDDRIDSIKKIVKLDLDSITKSTEDNKFIKEQMDEFYELFDRCIENEKTDKFSWDKVQTLPQPMIIELEAFASGMKSCNKGHLDKLVVLKLNGGLSTSIGLKGPKSNMEIRKNKTFLDVTVQQINHLNKKFGCDIPLVLMNSFNTHADTEILKDRYENEVSLHVFVHNKFPKLSKETLRPIPKVADSPDEEWYPPGHGDVYKSLLRSGMLDKFIKEGKEFMFISNIDNLGATVDLGILHYLVDVQNAPEFVMELTDKSKSDVKGGALVKYDRQVRLLEKSQVPSEKISEFHSNFKEFNTNNLWVNLKALKSILDTNQLYMEVIVNHLPAHDGSGVTIQLETAAGAAVRNFSNVLGVKVPRSRFLPVKSTSDLLLIRSNLYSVKDDGLLEINPDRPKPMKFDFDHPKPAPLINLGDHHFQKIERFESRIQQTPKMLELDHLVVSGDVTFGENVTLKGVVIIIADDGKSIRIKSGDTLENKIVLSSKVLEYY